MKKSTLFRSVGGKAGGKYMGGRGKKKYGNLGKEKTGVRRLAGEKKWKTNRGSEERQYGSWKELH